MIELQILLSFCVNCGTMTAQQNGFLIAFDNKENLSPDFKTGCKRILRPHVQLFKSISHKLKNTAEGNNRDLLAIAQS